MQGQQTIESADWLAILKREVEKTSITQVAEKLGYARPTISLVMSGKYGGSTDKIAALVITTFTDYVQCPFLGQNIERDECVDHQSRGMPSSDPAALKHWMRCRTDCPYSYHSLEEERRHA